MSDSERRGQLLREEQQLEQIQIRERYFAMKILFEKAHPESNNHIRKICIGGKDERA